MPPRRWGTRSACCSPIPNVVRRWDAVAGRSSARGTTGPGSARSWPVLSAAAWPTWRHHGEGRRAMRIVILARSTTAHRFGGIETHAASLARGAARLGHEIIVLSTSHPSGLVEEQRDGAWYRYLPGTPPAVYTHAWRVESVRAVANLVRAADVDLVLSLGLSGCALADARLGVPHHVIAYGEVLTHVVSEWHEAHGFRGLSAYPKHALATLYYAWLERRLWSRVDSVVATDERLRRRLCRLGYRARLAYTGIALEAFAPDGEAR